MKDTNWMKPFTETTAVLIVIKLEMWADVNWNQRYMWGSNLL